MHHPNRRFFLSLLWTLLLLPAVAAGAAPDAAAAPWRVPFHDDVEALLAAAAEIDEDDAGLVFLVEERQMRFDADGRQTGRLRRVYRIDSPALIEGWGHASALWKPWHQARPEIRARVITAAGDVHWLDPETLTELPRYEDSPDILSDWLQVRAPLPAVGVGAVVEEEIVYRDLEPGFAGGSVYRFQAGRRQPIEYVRLVVEAPPELPLRFATDLVEEEPEISEVDGLVRHVFDLGRVEGGGEIPPNLPPEVPRRPMIAVATGVSWADVAAGYHAIVENALDGFVPSPQVARALGDRKARRRLDRRQKITALISWLHREVRYTGLEYGEAAIVPRSPAETLERRYGDCKDKSTLLAALLRGAGIPAHLALLRTGPGRDVFPELPGLGQFDHAIVYVPPGGGPDEGELWIDATSEAARPGQLPLPDQDRWALVVRPGSEALVKTPAPTSADNLYKEHQDVFLAAIGPARVVETVEYHGFQERWLRRVFAQIDAERLREMFSEQLREQTEAEEIGRLEISDPHDLTAPMTLTVEALRVDSIMTELDAAEVSLELGRLVASLYDELDLYEGEEDGEEDGGAASERQADFEVRQPYVAEHSARVVPPPGFRGVDLPAGDARELGTAVLTTEVTAAEAGEVTVRARFDSGPRRLTPAELAELRSALRDFAADATLVLRFEQVGERHLAAGRVGEALGEFRRLVGLEPDQALHHTRIARALLAAGLGAAARREARRAVELEPSSGLAYQTLGMVLAHDLIGRQFAPGMDAEGAEAAWLEAKKLEPDNAHTRRNLALLYEHDADGFRYSPRARLDDAIAEYRALRDDLEVTGLDDELLTALFRAGRYQACRSFAEEIGADTILRFALQVAAAAAEEGFEAGHELALTLEDDERRQVLGTAAQLTIQARRYPLAAELLTAAARGRGREATSLLGQAAVLRKTRRYEELSFDPADPKSVYQRLTRALAFDERGELTPFYRMAEAAGMPREDLDDLLAVTRNALGVAARETSIETTLDLALIPDDLAVDGDAETGYRLRVLDGGGGELDVYFFAPAGAALRLLAVRSLTGVAPLGREVRRRLDAGDEAAARRWLDWAREHAAAPDVDDPYSGDPVARFWKRGAAGGPPQMRWAAVSLTATGYRAAEALPEIERGLAEAAAESERRRFELARLQALFHAERHPETVAAARRALAAEPTSLAAFQLLVFALRELERQDDVEQAAAARLERLPGDAWALRVRAEIAESRGHLERSAEIRRRMAAAGKAAWIDYNNLAWLAVVRGAVDLETLEHAQTAVRLSQQSDAASLHTLATVFAELGEAAAAREVILETMAVSGAEAPESDDWYVLGRIAEHYGLTTAAVEAYRKVEPPELEREAATSTHLLARRRLAALAGADGG